MSGFVGEMDAPVAAKPEKIDPYMIFLRGFYGSPERQRVEEYLREQRDGASRNKVGAVEENNQSALSFFSGCQHTLDELLRWLQSCDPSSAE